MTSRVTARKVEYAGPVFNLVTESVQQAEKADTAHTFIDHEGAVITIASGEDGRLLLLSQYRHTFRDEIWEFPAGTLAKGEAPLACAERELEEETGFRAARWESLGQVYPLPAYTNARMHVFYAERLSPGRQQLEEDESIQVHWFSMGELLGLLRRGELRDSATVAGLLLYREWSGS